LFKRFADIDVMPICLCGVFDETGHTDAYKLIETVKRLEPTFGGINLEDIASPACFEIEQTLKKEMSIPVFHDDQHGTAIISLAAVLNALELLGKRIEDTKFVINGAGAAGIACAEMYLTAGADVNKFILCDSHGTIHSERDDLTPEKIKFAHRMPERNLEDALKDADVLVGLSVGNCVTEDMIRSMADRPVVFPMANPTPEILPDKAVNAGAAVVGTGRSDFVNQINNVLGFPGIFRGALDIRASDINEAMKLGASKALAEIAKERVPDDIYAVLSEAYPEDAAAGMFDGECPLKSRFVIPKPFDPRVVPRVARYVAEAAMVSGTAQVKIADLDDYERAVAERIKKSQ
jgi:malate dehydrogenase (oxaloacetate-decarboxylating)(NADP+)